MDSIVNIGKALVHGTPSRVADAAMNCEPVCNHHRENTGYFEEGLTDFDLQHM